MQAILDFGISNHPLHCASEKRRVDFGLQSFPCPTLGEHLHFLKLNLCNTVWNFVPLVSGTSEDPKRYCPCLVQSVIMLLFDEFNDIFLLWFKSLSSLFVHPKKMNKKQALYDHLLKKSTSERSFLWPTDDSTLERGKKRNLIDFIVGRI